jgi:hypothetical protein
MTMWQIIFGFGLLLHGIGHALGIIPVFASVTDSWNTRSWLLSDQLGEGLATGVAVCLWAVCLIGFVAAGLGVLGFGVPGGSWRSIAVAFAVLSLVTLAMFWEGFPVLVPNKVGAIAVDVVLIVGIVFASWPSDEMLTS